MSEDTDVEVLMPNEDLRTSTNGAKGSAKRSSNYTRKEDIQLCISWQSISSDPIIGNEQPGKAYWQRIAEHYHANHDFKSDRNANSLEHRWGNIQKEVLEAEALYSSTAPKNRAFQFNHCWLKLRNSPKFQTLESHKRPRSRKSSTPIERAGEEDEGDDASKSTAPDLSQPSAKKRPIDRKQAKEKLKNGGEDGPYKEAMKDLLDAKEKEAKLKEERWKGTKEIQERKLLFAERKLVWDQEQKIMFCDVSTLEPDVRTYVLAMRAQIAASKVAALNGGFDGSSGFGGEFGGGNGEV
ncbi:glutathione S-transferase T3-like [Oryza sativa Japonica Group]|uniref:glutathione S-transferase T3-like n=1 Tax=Oryza sativa subsp. japonica TaxID=39947 RepID=UPI0007755D73|nr:glutathione S-transferase T3-like [Oryza sativa Japonica Group]